MRNNAKQRQSRARPGFIREGWQTRVHPAFASYWSSLKRSRSLPKRRDKRQADRQFEQWYKEFAAASRAYDDAKDKIDSTIGAKIQSTILKRLAIEGPI